MAASFPELSVPCTANTKYVAVATCNGTGDGVVYGWLLATELNSSAPLEKGAETKKCTCCGGEKQDGIAQSD